ncbi:hypothetical protein SAMN05421736_101636 [Evansella caseinilytica]|uniref:Ethanolamine utilization protein n=1 Tax=Evansella caseinilytica TaxID=1503961 RepID=A0A1H3HWF5_9BACI|nr:hypothetical protein [Evansella caseinilytica]SDY19797.1 hypothetical protein SAMN05421736_101636 [Evansella caseinilytica]
MNNDNVEQLLREVLREVENQLAKGKALTVPAAAPSGRLYVLLTETEAEPWRKTDSLLTLVETVDIIGVLSPVDVAESPADLCPFQTIKRCFPDEAGLSANDGVLLPCISKTNLAKAALCMADNFETRWIEYCLTNGISITIFQEGLPVVSERAALPYRSRFIEYQRQLQSYGVHVKSSASFWKQYQRKAEVVTAEEIGRLKSGEKVYLSRKAVLTPLAKEEAAKKQIEVLFYKPFLNGS